MLYDRITGWQDRGAGGGTRGGNGIRITGYSPLLRTLLRRRWVVIGCALMLAGDSGVVGSLYRYGVYAESREQGVLCRYQVAGRDSVGAYRFGCR